MHFFYLFIFTFSLNIYSLFESNIICNYSDHFMRQNFFSALYFCLMEKEGERRHYDEKKKLDYKREISFFVKFSLFNSTHIYLNTGNN